MRVLIVGAGVAGAATALALHKLGHDPVVFEAYDRTADGVGAYLVLATNGLDALAALDVKEQVRSRGTDAPTMRFHNEKGRLLGTARLGGELADGSVTQVISRSDLYATLVDEVVARGIKIEYGKRFAGAEVSDEGVRVTFADGSSAEGDFLVGADGLRSAVREVVDPETPGPHLTASISAGGLAEPCGVGGEPGEWYTYFGRGSFFGYIPRADGKLAWFVSPPVKDVYDAVRLASAPEDAWRAELLRLLATDRTPAARIVEATTEMYTPAVDYGYPTDRPWFADRIVLVGDAAHPTPPAVGQGASMALEDAVILAKCLRDHRDLTAAFARFDTLRRPRVIGVIKTNSQLSYNMREPLGPVVAFLRNVTIAAALRWDARRVSKGGDAKARTGMQWIWDHHLDWDAVMT